MQTVKSKKGLFKLKQERETESEEKIILYFKPGDFSKPLQGGEIEAEIQMIWRNYFTKICPDSGAKALNWGLDMRQNLSPKVCLVELAGILGHFFKDKIQALERHTESFMVRASHAFLSLVMPALHPKQPFPGTANTPWNEPSFLTLWISWTRCFISLGCIPSPCLSFHLEQGSPTFLAPGTSFMEDNFSTDRSEGGWFGDDCAVYFYYSSINSTTHHQTWDPGG